MGNPASSPTLGAEGADQACPTDQILSSPRIEALGNRLIYLLKVVRVEGTPGTFAMDGVPTLRHLA